MLTGRADMTRGRPMTSAGFHGREQELRLLADEANEAAAGRLRVLFIEGEAGIGKTRLMAEAATEAERSGHAVYLGAAEELGARPFGALADAFACTAGSDERPEILRLLNEGAGHDPGLRFRIVDAFLELMEKEAKSRTLLLALDDLQWSDASTLQTIGSALRRLTFAPLLFVGLLRPSPRPPDLDRLLDASTRQGALQITLGPLGEEEVASLVEDAIGGARDLRLTEMLSGAAGNPLFVTEVLSALREQGANQVGPQRVETRTPALPASLRVTLLRRIGYLSQPTLEVLRIASVLGASFHPSELASVAGRSPIELAPLIDEACRAAVLIDAGDVLRFRHGLIREAIYQDHAPAVRASLHAEAARRLASSGAPATRVAQQHGLGARHGDMEAVAWLQRAAEETVSSDPAGAIEMVKRAAELSPAGASRDDLLTQLATFEAYGGRPADAERTARDLLLRAASASAEAGAWTALVHALYTVGRWTALVSEVERACARPAVDDVTRARLHSEAALARMFLGDAEGAARDARKAIRLGELAGDPVAVCYGLGHLAVIPGVHGSVEEGVAMARRALAVAEGSPEAERRHPHLALAMALVAADRLREAIDALAESRRLAERWGTVWDLPLYHAAHLLPRYYLGEWDDAVAAGETSLSLAEETGVRVGSVAALGLLAEIAARRADLGVAEQLVGAADAIVSDAGPQAGMLWLELARLTLLSARGEHARARDLVDRLRESALSGGATDLILAIGPILARSTEDRAVQAAIAEAIEDAASRVGNLPYARAGALVCRGLATADPDALLEAISEYRKADRTPDVALASEDAGAALAAEGRTDEARRLFAEALETMTGISANGDIARIAARMRHAGIRRGVRGPRRRASSGWAALTPAELRVAKLVAEGLTNPEIAERLFISRDTVKTHIGHVFSKLGVVSRRELAAEVRRHPP